MRIISQDLSVDIPYELSALSTGCSFDKHVIYARSKLLDEKPCVFAEYSSDVKAKKVFDMVYTKYSKLELLKMTYQNGLAKKLEKELGIEETLNVFDSVFVFPTDEEVVVDG